MPSPSAGCQTCKIRRIKCDGTKPTCQRCLKSRRLCLDTSAAKQACFSILVENSYASGKAKRPRGPRSSLTVLRPQLDLQTQALAYFMQYHMRTTTDEPKVSGCLSESVFAWKVSGRTSHLVDLGLSSLALTIFARCQKHAPAAAEASSKYYHLLRVAQEPIAEVGVRNFYEDERKVDACLLAVTLMGRYEGASHRRDNINSNCSFGSLQSWSHHDGAMAILKVLSDNLSHTAPTLIVKQTRRELIKSYLLRNLQLPEWIRNGENFGERGLDLHFDGVTVQIVNLRHSIASLQHENELQVAKSVDLNNQARELDERLQDWADQFTTTCSYERHVLTEPGPAPDKHFYSSTVYSYSKPGFAAVWGQYFATRMLINSTRLKILEQSLPTFAYEQQWLECVAKYQAMANSLASTIPFCLDRVSVDRDILDSPVRQTSITLNKNEEINPYLATLVIWPLTIASSLGGFDLRQQLWFRSELARLGRVTGDGVLEFAETDQWAIVL